MDNYEELRLLRIEAMRYFEDNYALKCPAPQRLIDYLSQPRSKERPADGAADGDIPEGRRDSALTSLGGSMRHRGMSHAAILAALSAENEGRCKPPLTTSQVEKIARSVYGYAPDGYAGVRLLVNGENGHADGTAGPTKPPADRFGRPVPFLDLQRDGEALWLWNGYLARGGITLFTALWKAGKTTLLAHLLHQLESGGTFCGRDLAGGKVLYVSEESQGRWAERRDSIGIGNHCRLLSRPFKTKPRTAEWLEFLDYVKTLQDDWPADLIVFDTISNLWPVRDENDAAEVQAALMPLHKVTDSASLLLVHHNRKGDGLEATATRGSGALPAFVDTIVELRRYAAADRQSRQRVLTGYGRHDETPPEVVVELTEAGFQAQGTAADVSCRELSLVIGELLPEGEPGLTVKQIEDAWPGKTGPATKRLLDALHHGTEVGLWLQGGEGRRGDPYRYWRPKT